MKLWVDDLRPPPGDDWLWYRTSFDALTALAIARDCKMRLEVASLDHDLGGDDTTRPIIMWMCEHNLWFDEMRVHTQNPVGREWLEGMIERYKT